MRDLAASRRYYEEIIGLHVEHAAKDALYLRGLEERNHHSLVLKVDSEPVVERLGFKIASEADLDKAYEHFSRPGVPARFVNDVPFQVAVLIMNEVVATREGLPHFNPLEGRVPRTPSFLIPNKKRAVWRVSRQAGLGGSAIAKRV